MDIDTANAAVVEQVDAEQPTAMDVDADKNVIIRIPEN